MTNGLTDFKYEPLHTNKYIGSKYPDIMLDYEAYSDSERYNALNPIYKQIVGKDIDKSSIVHLRNASQHNLVEWIFPKRTPHEVAFVDVKVDQETVDHTNNLAQNNALRRKMDTNGDNFVSKEEINNYYDKFRVSGYEYGNSVIKRPDGTITIGGYQSEDTGKISHFDIENIGALANNSIIQDALFTKYNGDGSFDTNAELSYNDIKDKSIISESDFRKLDIAFDGAEDGLISKDVFKEFNFDKNNDHIIDEKEYAEGMDRVNKFLEERGNTINGVLLSDHMKKMGYAMQQGALDNKECNNECAKNDLPKQECQEAEVS